MDLELPPPSEEPNPKKPKMSTTTSDEDVDRAAIAVSGDPTPPRKPRYKRRKVAIFFAYCGVGYQGMQKNPGAKTIEGDLEEALFHAGAVPEQDRGQPKRFDWARSARTDKGVSAVGQVVSGYVDPPGFIERFNSNLPYQIRIFGFKRVTASFHAKKFCDRRRYVYLIPVFALDPSCHRDRESVIASLGSGNELVKCLECSERGRKIAGVMGNSKTESPVILSGSGVSLNTQGADFGNHNKVLSGNFDSKTESLVVLAGSGISSNIEGAEFGNDNKILSGTVDSKTESPVILAGSGISLNTESADFGNDNKIVSCTFESKTESPVILAGSVISSNNDGADFGNDSKVVSGTIVETKNDDEKIELEPKHEMKNQFEYGEEERKRFNRILKYYEGTHNFHNYTTRTKAEDPSAQRYIISFNANTTVNVDGIEFVKCEVVGQSFMLHQIRKMIGLAVAVMRNCALESLIEEAFRKDININVPTAPEVGLYLDECLFTSYNQKWRQSHEELSMKDYAEEAEDFKMKYIYSHIAAMEHKEGVVALWLHSLNHRNYPHLQQSIECNGASNKIESVVVEDMAE